MNVVPIGEKVEELEATFEEFWLVFPRRVARKDALKAWSRISPELYPKIITAVVAWRAVWMSRELQYCPHAATFLNGERWDDELPSEFRRAAHVPFAPQPHEKKSVMPEHVKAMIAKLRSK